MKKIELANLLAQLQGYLDEIATLPKDKLDRFLFLKKRSMRVLRRIKREFPEADSFSLQGPSLSVRREGAAPVEGVNAIPDTPPIDQHE